MSEYAGLFFVTLFDPKMFPVVSSSSSPAPTRRFLVGCVMCFKWTINHPGARKRVEHSDCDVFLIIC